MLQPECSTEMPYSSDEIILEKEQSAYALLQPDAENVI